MSFAATGSSKKHRLLSIDATQSIISTACNNDVRAKNSQIIYLQSDTFIVFDFLMHPYLFRFFIFKQISFKYISTLLWHIVDFNLMHAMKVYTYCLCYYFMQENLSKESKYLKYLIPRLHSSHASFQNLHFDGNVKLKILFAHTTWLNKYSIYFVTENYFSSLFLFPA